MWVLSNWPKTAKALADPAFSVGKASLSASFYSKSEADALLALKMPLAGGTFTGDVTWQTTSKAIFGDAAQYIHRSAASILSYVTDGYHSFVGQDANSPCFQVGTTANTLLQIQRYGAGAGAAYTTLRAPGGIMVFYVAGTRMMDCAAAYTRFYGYLNVGSYIYRPNHFVLHSETDDGMHMAIGNGDGVVNRHFIFCDYTAYTDDYDHSTLSAHPTVFIHSVTRAATATDEYLALSFPTTHALLAVGSGWLEITPDILSPASAKHYFDAGASQGTEYITSGADTYLDLYHGAGGGTRFYDENNLLLTVSRLSAGGPTQTLLTPPVKLNIYPGGVACCSMTGTYFQAHRDIRMSGSGTSVALQFFNDSAYVDAIYQKDAARNIILDPTKAGGKVYIGATADDEIAAAKYHVNTAFTEYAHSADAGHYDIEAGTSIDLNADTGVTGNIAVSGTVDGVDVSGIPTTYMPLAGGTFTGAVTLSGAPTADLHPATKKYVDDTQDAFGAWAAKALDTVYQAAQDGFAVVSLRALASGGRIQVYGYSDGSNPPTTERTAAEAYWAQGSVFTSICMPVRKDDYWKITTANSAGSYSALVNWLPARS